MALTLMNANIRASLADVVMHQRCHPETPEDVLRHLRDLFNKLNKIGADSNLMDDYLSLPVISANYEAYKKELRASSAITAADELAINVFDAADATDAAGAANKPKGDQAGQTQLFDEFLKKHYKAWKSSYRFNQSRRFFNWMNEQECWEAHRVWYEKHFDFEA